MQSNRKNTSHSVETDFYFRSNAHTKTAQTLAAIATQGFEKKFHNNEKITPPLTAPSSGFNSPNLSPSNANLKLLTRKEQ